MAKKQYGSSIGSVAGMGIGAAVGGPLGAAIGSGLGGIVGGLFDSSGGDTNPNEWALGQAQKYEQQGQQFLDPNNALYTGATKNYFSGLNQTLNASSPNTQSLLASQVAAGGDYGGSAYIAGKQRQQQMTKNVDAASQSANQFNQGLFQQGLGLYQSNQQSANQMYNLYGGGQSEANQSNISQMNNVLGLGGGLLARYFGGQGPGSGASAGTSTPASAGTSTPVQTDYNPNMWG